VKIKLNTDLDERLILPAGTQLTGAGLVFETVEAVAWDPHDTSTKEVAVVEGETFEEIFTSDGTQNQVIFLSKVSEGLFLANKEVQVFVNGVLWEEVDFLPFEQRNVYEVSYVSRPPFILFGDGVSGNIPPNLAEIKVVYRVHHGKVGNVKKDTITSLRVPIFVGTEVVDISVNNDDALIGGDDGLDIDSIRRNAPFVFKSVGRLVTEEDYNSVASSFSDPVFGAVAKAKAVIVRDVSTDIFIQDLIERYKFGIAEGFKNELLNYLNQVYDGGCRANIVQLFVVERDGVTRKYVQASIGLVRALKRFLDSRKESTVRIVIMDGTRHLFEVDIECKIKVAFGFDAAVVKANVEDVLKNFLLDQDFGQAIRLSDLYQMVEEVEGVEYSYIKILQPVDKITAAGDLEIAPYEITTLGMVNVIVL
jgi:hypothetical protein